MPVADTLTSLSSNPLVTRSDVQIAALDLWRPVVRRLSPGSARARLGHTGADFSATAAELEGFARPLWGLVPLAAGGGEVDWTPIVHGLEHGSDPEHPEFWGWPANRDQRLVEMAPIGLALAMVPEHVWDSLPGTARDNLARWLSMINTVDVHDNNWLYFRVLVNRGLKRVGAAQYDAKAEAAALDRLESFYVGDGWYQDGPTRRCDYYIPWAMHFYALVYARLAADGDSASDSARATRLRERAAEFAARHLHWFADDGAAVPYGRSLTYRFAQAGFWGALAFADIEALPWGGVKGLLLRNLRWWLSRPITDNADVLGIGYAYPNLTMAESYNSPGSPYWALKAFIGLAVAETHPFWEADETTIPSVKDVDEQPEPRMIMCRDRVGGHVFALAGGQPATHRHGGEKYAKFAYSTAFGFSVPHSEQGLPERAADSMLALSDDKRHWRVRVECQGSRIRDGVVWTRWCPWRDVEIDTWLFPHLPWHVRVHRLNTSRHLWSAEGGWAADRGNEELADCDDHTSAGTGWAAAIYPRMVSGVRDLTEFRQGEVVFTAPNTNLMYPRAAVPTLRHQHEPGEHWLVCAVLGSTEPTTWREPWNSAPTLDEVRALLPNDVNIPDGLQR